MQPSVDCSRGRLSLVEITMIASLGLLCSCEKETPIGSTQANWCECPKIVFTLAWGLNTDLWWCIWRITHNLCLWTCWQLWWRMSRMMPRRMPDTPSTSSKMGGAARHADRQQTDCQVGKQDLYADCKVSTFYSSHTNFLFEIYVKVITLCNWTCKKKYFF